jgi:hypothetical protein
MSVADGAKLVRAWLTRPGFHTCQFVPREWIRPLETEVRKAILTKTAFEAGELLNCDFGVEGTRRTLADIASTQPPLQLGALAGLIAAASDGQGQRKSLEALSDPTELPPGLIEVLAQGFDTKDYESVLNRSKNASHILFRLFFRRFPSQALQFLDSVSDRYYWRMLTATMKDTQIASPPQTVRSLLQRWKSAQPTEPECASFLPFVRAETIPDIVEVIKWPTCEEPDRRALMAALASVARQDFAAVRFKQPVADWRRFVGWAERNHYDEPVAHPKNFRSFKNE